MQSEVCGPHTAKMKKRGGGVGALAPGLRGKNEGGREGETGQGHLLPRSVSWEGKGSCSLVAVKRRDGEGESSWEGAGGWWGERAGGPWGWGAPAGKEVVRLDDEEVEGSSAHSSWVGAVRYAGGAKRSPWGWRWVGRWGYPSSCREGGGGWGCGSGCARGLRGPGRFGGRTERCGGKIPRPVPEPLLPRCVPEL